MTLLNQIGLEQEVWLLNQENTIIEPSPYSFPHDDFGFLIEIRSLPHTSPEPILKDMQNLYYGFSHLAEQFNFHLKIQNSLPLDKPLIERLSLKYNYANLKDLTQNIHSGGTKTHATGISESSQVLTAGLHVHFSQTLDSKRVQLPIRKFVAYLDKQFASIILETHRIRGEYEIKPYGFEYRSLPSTVNLEEVLKASFDCFKFFTK